MNIKSYLVGLYARLRSDEEGLALTEYLILLGLLTAAVVLAILAFGQNLGAAWQAWSNWITGLDGPPSLPS
ncbi:Flp family type IVb pilin [Cognatishimia activa]|uniref:Flp pilus assembly protein, pilin Flp n=1 Tax=Cognatishimia activa TaxID=1715691 RepID=A0A0P1IVL1_9RHOB|nr:hypothetical protein [Cognatishimia activa]CUJ18438.1 Flp pilus assembly protein, pilin Flp [Cognatishimia activa]CUK27597.1 Flp pilus assembly protein, pilin Flp [Cognatishimia activa]